MRGVVRYAPGDVRVRVGPDPLDRAAEGCTAMDERRAIKTLLRF